MKLACIKTQKIELIGFSSSTTEQFRTFNIVSLTCHIAVSGKEFNSSTQYIKVCSSSGVLGAGAEYIGSLSALEN